MTATLWRSVGVLVALCIRSGAAAEAFEVDAGLRAGSWRRTSSFGTEVEARSMEAVVVFRLKNVPPGATRVQMIDCPVRDGVVRFSERAVRELAVPPPIAVLGGHRVIHVPVSGLSGLRAGEPSTHRVWFVALGRDSRASPPVVVRYAPPRQDPVGPHTVRVRFEEFEAVRAQEAGPDEDGDEPYFLAFLHALDRAGSGSGKEDASVRTVWSVGSQDSAGANRVRSGRFSLRFSSDGAATPVEAPSAEESKARTWLFLTVVWLEQDASPSGTSPEIRTAVEGAVRAGLENRIRVLRRGGSQIGKEAFVGAVPSQGAAWTDAWRAWAAVPDPDDVLGVATVALSLEQLVAAGDEGVPVQLEFRGQGAHYVLRGRVLYVSPR